MAATPMSEDAPTAPPQDKWNGNEEGGQGGHDLEPVPDGEREANGTASANGGGEVRAVDQDVKEDYRLEDPGNDSGGKSASYREKQVKPNKVYIGGLPEHTRQEDLKNCFGKIGDIVNIELKLGYGFVEFDTKEAAEESVAKYHEGYFMGNKIRVELSHGGSRAQKAHGDSSACFKCGNTGHWARECPNAPQTSAPPRKSTHPPSHHADHGDRSYPSRDYPPKEYPPYPRDNEYGRYPPARGESRYSYDYPPQAAPAPPPAREYRRPASPPRDYRDYPAPLRRDYDDYRARAPPAPAPPRGYYPPELPSSYPPRAYEAPPPPPPPPRDFVDRGTDRRPPQTDRYSQYPQTSRPRTPPGPPPRTREEYDRPPPRDYPPPEYRGRPSTPPLPSSSGSRYGEYSSRNADQRYRRRSQSPPPRSGYRGGFANDQADPGYVAYGPASAPYPSNGYNGNISGAPNRRDRDYPPRGAPDLGGGFTRRG